jgi:protein-L-isoaspartate(D-aspartate) O-methyltransferase
MADSNEEMIQAQLVARGVANARVLSAFRAVDRRSFVPEDLADQAYEDKPLPLADMSTISQPYIVGAMVEILAVKPTHKVLEIGFGSGYQLAILSKLAREVWGVELLPEMVDYARARLPQKDYPNVHLEQGNGWAGLPGQAPFDRIIVAAASPEVPESLKAQLAPGGRLLLPIGEAKGQNLHLVYKKEPGLFSEQILSPVQFVPLREQL